MTDRDNELDELLAPLRQVGPSKEQMGRWQAHLRRSSHKTRRLTSIWQLAAACAVGIVIGFALKGQSGETETIANYDSTATVEVVYTKTE